MLRNITNGLGLGWIFWTKLLFYSLFRIGVGLFFLREERTKNRVLTTVFGPKGEEVTVNWAKLQNEGLHNLNYSPNIITGFKSRRMR